MCTHTIYVFSKNKKNITIFHLKIVKLCSRLKSQFIEWALTFNNEFADSTDVSLRMERLQVWAQEKVVTV